MGDQEHGETTYKDDVPPPSYSQQQVWCTILTGVMLVIPISMIAVGAVFLHDCHYERYIPIYLIVGGVFSTLLNIYRLVHSALGAKKKEGRRGLPFDMIVGLFLFCWFIAGNVWIYSIYRTVNLDDTNAANYCRRPLYLYSFWITTIGWIFIILSLLCGCLCGCIAACICEPK
ncbi:transmembrane protein 272-like isoform X2 [Lineus longissimus]|uniref:transmembrane protein 272-like isoform X2 n=1 Tax=Lineus longissimus TaxID=88925 RepID=UPI00315DB7C5